MNERKIERKNARKKTKYGKESKSEAKKGRPKE